MTAQATLTPALQRSHGEAAVGLGLIDGQVRLRTLRQIGSAKAILPHVAGAAPEVVFLNTSGGLTGGDRLDCRLTLGPGCRALATTQTAERAYLSGFDSAPARVSVSHQVGPGGWLDWLPQETILFQGAALTRHTRIDLGPGAGCLVLEAVVLGRAAMGETVTRLAFRDTRLICRDGRPILLEPLHLDDASLTAGSATLGQARAFASLALVAPGSAEALPAVRAVLNEPAVEAAASAFDGKLTLRLLAPDGWPLRRQIARVLAVLRPGPLPRVWQI